MVSYDTWVSPSDVEGDVEDPPTSEKPWKVRMERPVMLMFYIGQINPLLQPESTSRKHHT